MFNPVSTYRIQFHKDFTFKNLQDIIPYLSKLGIKTLYASPIFEATPGSTHGYDVVNPLNINPEIGTLEELHTVSEQLKKLDINWLQDIVPNHMAYHPNNKWLMDVLEKGKASAYASYFDIGWESDIYNGRIMVPFLGVPFNEAVEQRQLQIIKKDGQLWFDYFGQQYPINVDSVKTYTPAYLKKVNNDPGLINEISNQQAYQLCNWQETDEQINFRRFFTVNGLICLNIQHQEVFDHYHQLIKQLLDEGIFQGLRVDHIDGLFDPMQYLKRLRELAGPETYIVVEKILEEGEGFPSDWDVQGNTGYDFLAMANNVFSQPKSEQIFTRNYQKLIGTQEEVAKSIIEKKAFILSRHMGGELENLYQLFKKSQLAEPADVTAVGQQLKQAIGQILIHCPVYRFYGNAMPLSEEETQAMRSVIEMATQHNPELEPALKLVESCLLERPMQGDADYNKRALYFYQRCMQFTGPLMAKGVEDTLMYTYNRFIGHNEVGDAPAAFGVTKDHFHQLMINRELSLPLSINGTSTHDTKRGEDVRARLNVITDLPDEWFKLVQQWQKENSYLKTDNYPDKNDEYFIYQSIIGAYPMPESGDDNFTQRMQEYLIKALREAKRNSDWAVPNENYEESTKKFITALLDKSSSFMHSFESLHKRVADHGIINALSQVLLKFTCPGVPDVYQGCELWDLSLVDPDNRRPVDYLLREEYLAEENIQYSDELWKDLWKTRYSGQIKSHLTKLLLSLCNADAKAFTKGEYYPVVVTGKRKDNVLAFSRQYGNDWYVTVVPLHLATITGKDTDLLALDWENTALVLPEIAPRNWKNLLTNTKGYNTGELKLGAIGNGLPLALLKLERPTEREAGLLLHVTSLPSAFGCGDIGPQAHQFINFLSDSMQRHWQMLPVNPVDKSAGYSPYSANSSIAGNTSLISPNLFVEDGWLSVNDLENVALPSTNRADFGKAESIKVQLFDKAYQYFFNADKAAQQEFEQFKSTEANWLDDYALYQALKQANGNNPWYKWPKSIKNRELSVLTKAVEQHADIIEKEKWLQYIFSKQWARLKSYAERKGITLFGDMPFYISYDSVDVWANRQLFNLNEQGDITGMAGVPPDYFSADGQLWGMPVYNWEVLKQNGYSWWLQRIRKNLEYFHLIRLDHFRAFSDYWEVPGGELTAVNGKWLPGPGADFFDVIKEQIGSLPFVAEDLGDVNDSVFELRDKFNLPGMRVLQFGFGADMPVSEHIPHNFNVNSFAYTGTHDNNTLKGWYQSEAGPAGQNAINQYVGRKVFEKNICQGFIRLCYLSVARAAIIPMQDVLELDGSHRMNIPSLAEGNWTWRVTEDQLTEKVAEQLRKLSILTNR